MFCWHKWSKWNKTVDKYVRYKDDTLAYKFIIQERKCEKCNFIETQEQKIFF